MPAATAPTITVPDPYGRTTLHGKAIDNATATRLRTIEAELGYPFVVFQGIGAADASGGTHKEGRVVDLDVVNPEVELPALKRGGFMAYYRRYRPGVWTEHYHIALIFESYTNPRGIAPAALDQIAEYRAGGDGLVGSAPDSDPWRPDPIPIYTREQYRHEYRAQHRPIKTPVTRARYQLRESIGSLSVAIARLDNVDPGRVVARNVLEDLRGQRAELREALRRLPQR